MTHPTTVTIGNAPLAMVTTPSSLPKYSKSIPFLRRPPLLTGEFAGDVGFDPLNLAKNREQLVYMREAEVKHARLAMLAAAGWPTSELFDKPLAADFNMAPALDSADRVPSLLNGGMDTISPLWWGFCLGLTAAIDLRGIQRSRYSDVEITQKDDDNYYLPGDYGFDPLNFYPSDKEGQMRMQLAEIKHGRLSMIAVTGFAAQEAVSKIGVVDETPVFFEPVHLGIF
mmetsp:Transcript_11763/g.24777  ORF Transcript_11763/g.24777 Transcript_11763/m.24777 type:complete len:227 (-) Transcript_11763:508-1188(-)|eukprot:CAMPEP_0171330932 /NCGR_PEP_ID=MMETSP0878-20121228/2352_1 /TAXON_ID=67004 /ORGANISM="Thalassiosira weissflogii, Strain CCMP1336" /LENGTH=226 /DNA_ID=CAMNT_0011831349 /DNA_START=7 /DNA_END=687 /DNA_ORIENTATION=+